MCCAVAISAAGVGRPSRGCIYARFSTRFQHSIDDQVRECKRWAKEHGVEVSDDHIYVDAGHSGRKRRREGFQRMMAELNEGQIDVVIAMSTNRLNRKIHLAMKFVEEEIVERRRRCVFVAQNIDTENTQFWKQLLHVFAMLDEWQIQSTAAHVRAAHSGLLLRGLIHGTLAYGYRGIPIPGELTRRGLPRRRWEVDPQVAEWVGRAFHWYAHEHASFAAIARRLRDQGAPLPPKSSRWRSSTVKYLLWNRRYIGDWSYGLRETIWQSRADYGRQVMREKPVEEHRREDMRIVSDELFMKAQELIAQKRGRGGRPCHKGPHERDFLLEVLWCPHHDQRLSAAGAHGMHLACRACIATDDPAERHLFSLINRDHARKVICEALARQMMADPDLVSRIIEIAKRQVQDAQMPDQQQLAQLRKTVQDIGVRNRFIMENPGETETDRQENAKQLNMLRAERATAERQIAELEAMASKPKRVPAENELRAIMADASGLLERAASGEVGPDAGKLMELVISLVGGRIEVHQCGERQAKHGWLEGRFRCRLIRHMLNGNSPTGDETGDEITISFRRPIEGDEQAERAVALLNQGRLMVDVGRELGVSKSRMTELVHHWYASRGEEAPDGRHRRSAILKATRGPLLHERIADSVGERVRQGLLLCQIARELGYGRDQITKAYNYWRQTQGLPFLDGRSRRKDLAIKVSGTVTEQPPPASSA